MKFTKEDANKELVAKMTTNGEALSMSQRSINENLENLIPLIATEEMELNDFVEKALPFFNTANSNIRNDVSAGIKEYKEKNPVQKTVKPVNQEEETKKDDDDKDELLKRIEAMEKVIKDNELAVKRNGIKSSLVSKLKEKGLKDEEWIADLLNEIPIGEDFDVESKAETYLNLYNKSKASVDINITPSQSGGGKNNDEALIEQMKKVKEYAASQNLLN